MGKRHRQSVKASRRKRQEARHPGRRAAYLLALAGGVWYIFRYFGRDQTGPPEDSPPDAASESSQP